MTCTARASKARTSGFEVGMNRRAHAEIAEMGRLGFPRRWEANEPSENVQPVGNRQVAAAHSQVAGTPQPCPEELRSGRTSRDFSPVIAVLSFGHAANPAKVRRSEARRVA